MPRVDLPIEACVECSEGQYLYGHVTYVTERGTMVVLAEWRRTWYEVLRRHKPSRVLDKWRRVEPPRKMLAVGGRFVRARPPLPPEVIEPGGEL